jgi:HAD superfamily hydrolase (TIGR01509 family)
MTGAIVFDFDGIIVDSEPAHCRSIEAALASMGMGFPRKHEYARYIGRGDREVMAEVAAEQGRVVSAAEMEQLVREKSAAFLDLARTGFIKAYPGSVELMRAAAGVVPVAVCSGSERAIVGPVLESLGVMGLLRTVVTANDVPRPKPDPAGYVLAAARLGVEPARAVAIEDSPTGIRAAREAGYRVCGVCHSFPRERLSGAHEVCETIAAVTLGRLGVGARGS